MITRTMAGLHDLWDSLDKNRRGELVRRDNDFSVRRGLCHEPTSKRDLFHFTICHKVLKFIDMVDFVKIAGLCWGPPYHKLRLMVGETKHSVLFEATFPLD